MAQKGQYKRHFVLTFVPDFDILLLKSYPKVADIQALDSAKYSCDEIALKFAEQLIKRLKT